MSRKWQIGNMNYNGCTDLAWLVRLCAGGTAVRLETFLVKKMLSHDF